MQSPYEQISFLRSTEKKRKGKIMKKRIFSIMMCLCMVLMLFPAISVDTDDGVYYDID